MLGKSGGRADRFATGAAWMGDTDTNRRLISAAIGHGDAVGRGCSGSGCGIQLGTRRQAAGSGRLGFKQQLVQQGLEERRMQAEAHQVTLSLIHADAQRVHSLSLPPNYTGCRPERSTPMAPRRKRRRTPHAHAKCAFEHRALSHATHHPHTRLQIELRRLRDEYEAGNAGSFELIYPSSHEQIQSMYDMLLNASLRAFIETSPAAAIPGACAAVPPLLPHGAGDDWWPMIKKGHCGERILYVSADAPTAKTSHEPLDGAG